MLTLGLKLLVDAMSKAKMLGDANCSDKILGKTISNAKMLVLLLILLCLHLCLYR